MELIGCSLEKRILYLHGLSLFRELPEGAWRLPPLSNMISLKAPMSAPAKRKN
jgi:hypothetical protein